VWEPGVRKKGKEEGLKFRQILTTKGVEAVLIVITEASASGYVKNEKNVTPRYPALRREEGREKGR